MKHHCTFVRLRNPSIVTIGNFDGFHLGHQAVAAEVIGQARAWGLEAVAVTFYPHPRLFLGQPVKLLQTPAQKKKRLTQCAFDHLFSIDFAVVQRITAGEFLQTVLLDKLRMKRLVFSGDFLFGSDREGNVAFLRTESERAGFDLREVEPVIVDQERVSSSAIRKKLERGDVSGAARMLGRPYTLEGKVIKGLERGRRLGFPTLNLQTDNRLLPSGVFASWCEWGGNRYPAVTHIGLNPTFPDVRGEIGVECHLIDRRLNLYGRRVQIHLIEKIRDEFRFSHERDLIGQITEDVAKVRSLLRTARD